MRIGICTTVGEILQAEIEKCVFIVTKLMTATNISKLTFCFFFSSKKTYKIKFSDCRKYEVLSNFIFYLHGRDLRMKIKSFFCIDYSLVMSLIGTTISYCIILQQFSKMD